MKQFLILLSILGSTVTYSAELYCTGTVTADKDIIEGDLHLHQGHRGELLIWFEDSPLDTASEIQLGSPIVWEGYGAGPLAIPLKVLDRQLVESNNFRYIVGSVEPIEYGSSYLFSFEIDRSTSTNIRLIHFKGFEGNISFGPSELGCQQ